MALKGADRLYALLPAVYREQDASNGFPLRGLTRIIGDQRWVLVDTGLCFTAVSKTLFIERFVRVWVHEAR